MMFKFFDEVFAVARAPGMRRELNPTAWDRNMEAIQDRRRLQSDPSGQALQGGLIVLREFGYYELLTKRATPSVPYTWSGEINSGWTDAIIIAARRGHVEKLHHAIQMLVKQVNDWSLKNGLIPCDVSADDKSVSVRLSRSDLNVDRVVAMVALVGPMVTHATSLVVEMPCLDT